MTTRLSLRLLRRSLLAAAGCLQLFVLLAAWARPAHAYTDPGSGLLLFQIGGSMLSGAVFMLRSKIRKLFHRSNPAEAETIEAAPAPTPEAQA